MSDFNLKNIDFLGAFKLENQGHGVFHLIFDLPGEKVNKFSGAVLAELDSFLDKIELMPEIDLLCLVSAKKGIFVAGADINGILGITNPGEAELAAKAGQNVFNKLAQLKCTTLAVINGACLGGGCEYALACDFRVASDSSKVTIGLPEVNLGILPGWGGTQRLPKLIGMQNALGMILAGKAINAKKAWKQHLVDQYFSEEFLEEQLENFCKQLSQNPNFKTTMIAKREKGLSAKLLEDNVIGQSVLFHKAKEGLIKKTKGFYKAPLVALDVLEETLDMDLEAGLAVESKAFAELAVTDTCKNLIQVFFTSEALKKETGILTKAEAIQFKKSAVIGAGVMGGGIAWAFSNKDIPIRMKDLNWDAVQKGYESASQVYSQLIKIRKYDERQVALKMNHISSTLDYSGFKNVDIVVEAVVENINVKKSVLAEVEENLSENTILTSNTSSLSITEMATSLKRPEKFAGLHFFNPVNRMPLVEIIPGEKTSDETITSLVSLVKKMGKTPVVVQNCPGFLVNRILIPYMNEAALILQEGANMERVDELILSFGMPMGPFTLADEVGIDVGYHVAKILEDGYGERMKTAEILEYVAVDQKLLGKKAGLGFYQHQGKEKIPNPDLKEMISKVQSDNNISTTLFSDPTIIDRCILSMVNEAAKCIEEKVVSCPEYLDMAMIMGSGFPPFRGGLLKYADQRGISDIVESLQKLEDKFGERFHPAKILIDHQKASTTFYPGVQNG